MTGSEAIRYRNFLRKWRNDSEAASKTWQKAYGEDYPHSALGCMMSYEYERWFKVSAA